MGKSKMCRGVMVRLSIPIVVFILAGCASTGGGSGSRAASDIPGNSLRVLTFNTALFSPIFLCGGPPIPTPGGPHINLDCHMLNDLGKYINERANLIADELDSGYFDVVALNEVWDEDDGKDELKDRLNGTYPHWVKYVDVFGGGVEEDSGLMLFSKLPFESLPDPYFKSEDNETSYGDDSDIIAYVKYEDCGGFDCWAAKGAVLARLKHPSSQRIINVVFTHLQADCGEDSIRSKQLNQVRAPNTSWYGANHPPLIGKTLGHDLFNWTNAQWLLVMGDLNIRGDGAVGDTLYSTFGPKPPLPEWVAEWSSRIGDPTSGSITTGYSLYDAWAETTSETDDGISRESEGRLDYILVSRRTAALASADSPDVCVQYIWNPPEYEGLSDHRPVAADLNLEAPQCNPRLAMVMRAEDMGELGFGQEKEAKKIHKSLDYPGSMQWFRLEDPGTYTIALDPQAESQGMITEVFEAHNLSSQVGGAYHLGTDEISVCELTPTGGPSCEKVSGKKMVLPKAPLYIRVFSTDRTFSGNYWIAIHQYSCKSKEEACELMANTPQEFNFPPANEWLNPEDRAWFHLQIKEQADSGQKQSLRFYAEQNLGSSWAQPEITLVDQNENPLTALDGEQLQGPISSTAPSGKDRVALEGQTGTNSALYLWVKRTDNTQDLKIKTGWQTDLTLLGNDELGELSAKLVCNDETNPEAGEDEIAMKVNIDGMGWHTRGTAGFDCNDKAHPRVWNSKIGVIRFLDQVEIQLVEGDAASGDDESEIVQHLALDMESDMLATSENFRYSSDFCWSDGSYTFSFNMHKSRRK